MSTGAERVGWLIDAAQRRGGDVPAQRDLEMWGYLGIRRREVAEHILWENRDALLAAFDELLPALDAPAAGSAPQSVDGPAEAPRRGTDAEAGDDTVDELDQRPEARFERLLAWRGEHDDPRVPAISDQDLARLASSGAMTRSDVEAAAARLSAHALVAELAGEVGEALGGAAHAEPEDAAAPEPEPTPDPVPEPTVNLFEPFVWERAPRFAPYSWAEGAAAPYGLVSADLGDDGAVQIAWTPAPQPAPVTVYRIVESASTWPSGAPELGGLIGVTRATSGSVHIRPSGPVTYLAVWANQGDSLLGAAHAQPRLVGFSQLVWLSLIHI